MRGISGPDDAARTPLSGTRQNPAAARLRRSRSGLQKPFQHRHVLGDAAVLAHQFLAVRNLGWDAGFQYYLAGLPALVFFLPPGRVVLKGAMLTVIALSFLGLVTMGRTAPVSGLDIATLRALEAFNIVSVFGMLGLFSGIYAVTAHRAEARWREAHAKAEHLLHNILPVPIAARLKDDDSVIADGFDGDPTRRETRGQVVTYRARCSVNKAGYILNLTLVAIEHIAVAEAPAIEG